MHPIRTYGKVYTMRMTPKVGAIKPVELGVYCKYRIISEILCFFDIFLCKNLSAAEGCPQWPQVSHLAALRLLARLPLLHIPLKGRFGRQQDCQMTSRGI
jgi:hypothetical protein